MGFKFFIARRFLFSKKSHSVINIISVISIFSVAIITAAMIIILSAINGFEDTIKTLYSNFDPDIKITTVKGKTFEPDPILEKKILQLEGIELISKTIEEICILKNNDQWIHATVKGVDTNFNQLINLEKNIDGEAILRLDDTSHFLIPGSLIASKLNSYSENSILPEYIKLYVPVRNKRLKVNSEAFNEKLLPVSGVFRISPEIDDQFVLADLGMINEMMQYNGEIGAYEIKTRSNSNDNTICDAINAVLPKGLIAKTRYQQKELIFKTNQTEKLFVFIILIFVLTLAGFNVIAALTMLVIDKQKDAATLQVLGADENAVRKIFFMNGLFINLIGGSIGLILGIGLVLIQFHYHIIPLDNAIIDYYPVNLNYADIAKSFLALMAIALFSSWFPVYLATRKKPIGK